MRQINYIIKKLEKYFIKSKCDYLAYEKFIVFQHYEYFERFLKGLPFPPIQVDFQLSSICNLNCRWCIGKHIASSNGLTKLADTMDATLVKKIVDEIVKYSIDGMHIETVMFSGLTGEPLMKKGVLYHTIEVLHKNNIKICLFTNGILMDRETWKYLISVDAIQVSLDGGKKSWRDIKNPYNTKESYDLVIENIEGLLRCKKENNAVTEINIGYTVTADNYYELEEVIKCLVDLGVNSICIKHDITNIESVINNRDIVKVIDECVYKYDTVNNTRVLLMHEDNSNNKSHWQCKKGCYYRQFFTTIGSDGCVYPCDYQTVEGQVKMSNLLDDNLIEALRKKNENWDEVTFKSGFINICPPFAEKINPFLAQVVELRDEFGVERVLSAIKILKDKFGD